MPKKLNILFLSIDALRADRVGLLGYGRNTTPRINALAEKGAIVCEENCSDVAFTQPSFHSFMTSSRPLSHGGYDKGAENRPDSLFKFFHDADYETICLSTFPWITRFFGYGNGAIDHEYDLFILNTLVGIYGSGIIASTLRAWHKGEVSLDHVVQSIESSILRMFDQIEDYCRRKISQTQSDFVEFPNSPLGQQRFKYKGVLFVVEQHRIEFNLGRARYIERYLQEVPRAHDWIAKDWRMTRTPLKLIDEVYHRTKNNILTVLNPNLAQLQAYRFKRYLDGADLAKKIVKEIQTRKKSDKPFFLWTHFIDTHVPYCAGEGQKWYAKTPEYLERLGYNRNLDISIAVKDKPSSQTEWETWSALYDATILYVDEQIGYIADSLEEMGILDETLIVICGDHGEELGEHGDVSHHFRLYDHNLRVPLIFLNPTIGNQRIQGLTSLLDLAPSLAEIVGLTPNSDWCGTPVTSSTVAQKKHQIFETFHGGSCEFDLRPLYMAVRTNKWKYLWKEYIDPTDKFSPSEIELYDHSQDPLEQNNLYSSLDSQLIRDFNNLITQRLREIPEVSENRIWRAFSETIPIAE
jgi:arylsulfatase A-like enzyme